MEELFAKNYDDFEGLISTKIFSDDIGCTFKKGSLEHFKTITLVINMEVTQKTIKPIDI